MSFPRTHRLHSPLWVRWLGYISGMVAVGEAAATGNAFIPEGYDFDASDVRTLVTTGSLVLRSIV